MEMNYQYHNLIRISYFTWHLVFFMCIAQHYISEHRHCFKRYLCRNSRPLWRECGVQGLWRWLVMRAPLLSCHVTLRLQLPWKKVTIIVILLETERKISEISDFVCCNYHRILHRSRLFSASIPAIFQRCQIPFRWLILFTTSHSVTN